MLRRSFRIGVLVGVLAGAIAAVVKAVQSRTTAPLPAAPAWTPIPDSQPVVVPPTTAAAPSPPPTSTATPTPARAAPRREGPVKIEDLQEPVPSTPAKAAAKKAPAKKAAPAAAWVEPVDGGCPSSHPVKAKLTSKIFHLPGGLNYARTQPDRCYIDAAAAEADGLRQAKR